MGSLLAGGPGIFLVLLTNGRGTFGLGPGAGTGAFILGGDVLASS